MKPKKIIESKFIKIICPRCSNKQVIFGKTTLKIKCEKCRKLLVKTTGGKTKIRAQVKKVL